MQKWYQHLPRQRRLNEEEKDEAKKVLALKANKKCVQGYFFSGGKKVLLRDLHNLTTMKEDSVKGSMLDSTASRVQESGGTMDILVDSDDVLVGLFYQDSDMKRANENFPEVVFVDANTRQTTNGCHCMWSL